MRYIDVYIPIDISIFVAHVKDIFSTMMWSLGFPIPAV